MSGNYQENLFHDKNIIKLEKKKTMTEKETFGHSKL